MPRDWLSEARARWERGIIPLGNVDRLLACAEALEELVRRERDGLPPEYELEGPEWVAAERALAGEGAGG